MALVAHILGIFTWVVGALIVWLINILAYNDAFLLVSGLAAFGLGCLLLHVLFRHIFPPTEPAAT